MLMRLLFQIIITSHALEFKTSVVIVISYSLIVCLFFVLCFCGHFLGALLTSTKHGENMHIRTTQ